jgi:hypothetical protein
MGWLSPKTTAEEKAEDHRRRGFDGPIDQDGDAHMSRRSDRPFGWTGTGSPDDKDSPRAGSLARRSRRN